MEKLDFVSVTLILMKVFVSDIFLVVVTFGAHEISKRKSIWADAVA